MLSISDGQSQRYLSLTYDDDSVLRDFLQYNIQSSTFHRHWGQAVSAGSLVHQYNITWCADWWPSSWASSWSLQITTGWGSEAASRYIYPEYLLSPASAEIPTVADIEIAFLMHFSVWQKYLQDCTIFCLNSLKYFGEISRYKTFYNYVGLETLKLEGAKNRIKCPETIQLILWLWQIVWSIVRSYGFKKSFFLVSFSGYM